MRLIIYEESWKNFLPLIYFYPQFNLHIGTKPVIENIKDYFPRCKVEHIARDIFKFRPSNIHAPTIYLSGRLLLKQKINLPAKELKFTVGSDVVGFLKTNPPFPSNFAQIAETIKDIKATKEITGLILNYPWDLIKHNETILLEQLQKERIKSKVAKGIEIVGKKKDLFVAKGATMRKLVVIDVTDGPVYIDKNATIKSFTTIIGPSYIGEGTIVDRAKIIKSSIGPGCRIGGEVDSCIFQGYVNKYHEGFIGHSFIGEWVNLGALTTNSDLKNNYSIVRIKIGEREHDTGLIKLGCFIGDHVKLGIGTLIPTGAVIGSFVNYFGHGIMPKYIAPFKWLGHGSTEDYQIEKAIETAKIVMKRRGVEMTKSYEELIRAVYNVHYRP